MICVGYNGFTAAASIFGERYGRNGRDRFRVLGHDAGAAVVVDGRVVAAAEEERFTRVKKTSAFPASSLHWCLREAGLTLADVDRFAFPWAFTAPSDPGGAPRVAGAPDGKGGETDLYNELLSPAALSEDFARCTGFEIEPERLVLVPHHEAHLACGYHLAGVEHAAFLVSDGRAEELSAVTGEIDQGRIRVLTVSEISLAHSLAILYSKITRFLGFEPNNDEYKVMGLSAYADPPPRNPLLENVLELGDSGSYSLTLPHDRLDTLAYESELEVLFADFGQRGTPAHDRTVAWCAQDAVEVATAHQIRHLRGHTGAKTLLIEGGLALNCVNNSRLLETGGFDELSVSYAASDVGVALGAALRTAALGGDPVRRARGTAPYLGPELTRASAAEALGAAADSLVWEELAPDDLIDAVAELLRGEVVIGWARGRLEMGPRALGNRSIIANPSFPTMKDTLNLRVKRREPFRPFAPIVLDHRAENVFELGKKANSPYMTFTFPVRERYRQSILAACHVDGTARIQTVSATTNPMLARLLDTFEHRTGIPCLVNTSFNVAGEPIVATAQDALRCFSSTEIDYLVLSDFLVSRVNHASAPEAPERPAPEAAHPA